MECGCTAEKSGIADYVLEKMDEWKREGEDDEISKAGSD